MSTITLTKSDNGRSVEARPDDEIVLLLAENATTGFRWHIDRANGILEVAEVPHEAGPPPADAQVVFGRGGLREFRFRVKEPGIARLELKHWQEWEGERSVVERFVAEVSVSGAHPQEESRPAPAE